MTIAEWLANNWLEIFGAITGIIYVFLEIRQNIWLWPVGLVTSSVYIIVFFTSKFYADMSLQGYYLVMSCIGWYWWVRGTGQRAQGAGHKAQGTGHRAQGAGHKAKGTGHRAQGEGHRAQGEGHRAQGEEQKTGGLRDEDTEAEKLPSLEGLGVGFEETKRLRDEETEAEKLPSLEGLGVGYKETGGLEVTRLKPITGLLLTAVFIMLYSGTWFILSRYTDSPVPEWDSFITSLSVIATWMLAKKIYEHWYLWIAVNSVASLIFFTRDLYPTVILYMVFLVMSFAGLREWKRSMNYL